MGPLPQPAPYRGVDRAQPYTTEEALEWAWAAVVGYYLPSPYADLPWSLAEANELAGSLYLYPLPIYVAALALTVGDGTKYANAAVALCRVFPNHGVVVLDIEEEAVSTTPTAVVALDIQEQVAREFIAEVAATDAALVPIIYGSAALYERLLNNFWVAEWQADGKVYPLSSRYPGIIPANVNGQVMPRPLGWQYSGDDTPPYLIPDLSVWLPFLFTRPDNINQEWRDMQKYTTEAGDTLDSISTKLYGNADNVLEIYTINVRSLRTYGPRGEIPEGTVLTVPNTDNTSTQEAASPVDVAADVTAQEAAPPATEAAATEPTTEAVPEPAATTEVVADANPLAPFSTQQLAAELARRV